MRGFEESSDLKEIHGIPFNAMSCSINRYKFCGTTKVTNTESVKALDADLQKKLAERDALDAKLTQSPNKQPPTNGMDSHQTAQGSHFSTK